MATVEKRRWEGGAGAPTRRDRLSCDYSVYLPDRVAGRAFALDGDVAAEVADAEAEIVRLDASATALAGTEALARLLLRAESVASSRIEGLEVGGRRLLRADAARRAGEAVRDVTAIEVLGNIEAMAWCVGEASEGRSFALQTLLETHRRLVAGTRLDRYGGWVRDVQNWIGGSDFNPCSAVFVPPPPEVVPGLLEDLLAFCNEDSLPAVAQAAIAHAQFETIHPFVDGNGRAGRALVHVVLRRRGLAPRVLPPVSLVLATWPDEYVAGLSATRYVGDSRAQEARTGINRWVAFFAAACRRAAEDAARFERRVRRLQDSWRERIAPVRRDSAARLLIDVLPGTPVLTTATAAKAIGRSYQATSQAVGRLAAAGILRQVAVGRRNRAFESPELLAEFTSLERQLASPGGDTRISAPERPVPRRS